MIDPDTFVVPMDDLEEVKARLDKASPAPWRALVGPDGMFLVNDTHILAKLGKVTQDADRDLVVHARADIERLYHEVKVARAHLKALLMGVGTTDFVSESPTPPEVDPHAAAVAYLMDAEGSW